MAGNHPIHIHPVCHPSTCSDLLENWSELNCPQARPLYRYTATLLSASMWFFVRHLKPGPSAMSLTTGQLMYRAKKDGAVLMGWKHPWDHWTWFSTANNNGGSGFPELRWGFLRADEDDPTPSWIGMEEESRGVYKLLLCTYESMRVPRLMSQGTTHRAPTAGFQ